MTQAMDSNIELLSVEYAFWLAHLQCANIEICFHFKCKSKKSPSIEGLLS